MNNLYRFGPINNKTELIKSVNYVIEENQKLCYKILGKNLQFSGYLTICAHYLDEFENLKKILLKIGKFDSEHNGLYVLLNDPIKTKFGEILKLRVRQPDPYRFQVGCGDFNIEDYDKFKDSYLEKHSPYLREIVRSDITMLEFWHPDFDTLAYVVKD